MLSRTSTIEKCFKCQKPIDIGSSEYITDRHNRPRSSRHFQCLTPESETLTPSTPTLETLETMQPKFTPDHES